MKKFKKLSVLLAGVMMLSCVSIMPVSAAEPAASRMEIFSQDFEGEDVQPTNFNGSSLTTSYNSKNYDNAEGRYGQWDMTATYRSGFKFDENYRNITSGKIYIKFDFMTTGEDYYRVVSLGDINASDNKWYGVTIFAINQQNANNGLTQNCITVGGRRISQAGQGALVKDGEDSTVSVTASMWYTYEGTLDLDKKSVTATITTKEKGEFVGSATAENLKYDASNSLWEGWPMSSTWPAADYLCDSIAVTCGNQRSVSLSLDNIKVEVDPINDNLIYRRTNAETENVYNNTKTVGVRFNTAMKTVDTEAVKLNDQPVSGQLSEDGKSYLFPVELTAEQEYTVTVDCEKLTTVSGAKCSGTKTFTFTPVDGTVYLDENFDGTEPTIYNYSGQRAISEVKYLYETQTENDNKYGKFHVSDNDGQDTNANFKRIGLDVSGELKDGKINVSFKFRPPVSNAMNTTVLIGNEPDSRSLYNWLSLLNVTKDGKLLIARTYNATQDIENDMVKNTGGEDVTVEQGNWYGYNAVIDLDTHSMDVKITDASGSELGGIKLTGLEATDGNYNLWPKETYFKAFATLFPTELDDIKITDYVDEEEPTPPPAEDVTATAEISADNGEEGYSVGLKFDQALNPSTYKNIVFKIGDEIRGTDVKTALGYIDGEALIAIILENATSREAEVKFTNKDITID